MKALRNAFGQFATGVCVVTAVNSSGKPVGVTINSFSSVSLDPPLALWSIQNNSDMFQYWCNTERYAINILSADQADLSGQCAKPGDHLLSEGQSFQSASGVPLLHGAVASFEMKLVQVVPAGDHHILIGEITEYINNEDIAPLVFHKGQYRALASTL